MWIFYGRFSWWAINTYMGYTPIYHGLFAADHHSPSVVAAIVHKINFLKWFWVQYTWKRTGRGKVGEEPHLAIKLTKLQLCGETDCGFSRSAEGEFSLCPTLSAKCWCLSDGGICFPRVCRDTKCLCQSLLSGKVADLNQIGLSISF